MMTTPTKHLSFETMLDAADRRDAIARETESHLATCEQCSHELSRVRDLLQSMREDRSVDAPRDVMAYAINIFAQRKSERQPSLARRIVAALSFDSFNRAPAFGFRSAGQTATRQLVYTAEDNDLDLRIEEHGQDRWVISGQFLGDNCEGGEVELQAHAGESTSAMLNSQCEFRLSEVVAGNYSLICRLPDREIEIREIQIGG